MCFVWSKTESTLCEYRLTSRQHRSAFDLITLLLITGLCLYYWSKYFAAYAICAIMVTMAIALLGNTCALRYHVPHSTRMGALSRYFILNFLGCILCCKNCCVPRRRRRQSSVAASKLTPGGRKYAREHIKHPEPETSPEDIQREWQEECQTAARVLDRFFFLFILTVIVCVITVMVVYRSDIPF